MEFPLPDESIESILNILDVPSLLRCMQVCKLFRSIISESVHLAYKIELFLSCMVDNEHSPMDTISRLNALREHSRIWNDMTWPSYGSIPQTGGPWEFLGGIFAQSTLKNEIFFVQLPCKPKGIPERRWTVPFDFKIIDFTFDNSQDLIVLLDLTGVYRNEIYGLHLRTLSGEHHPQSTVSQIQYALGNDLGSFIPSVIQICGVHLAVLFSAGLDDTRMIVWNWKTGQRKMYIDTPELRSFVFMTEDLILAAVLRSDREPALQILRVGACDYLLHSLKDAPYICELLYHEFRVYAERFLIRSDPIPASKPPAGSTVPFYCSQKDIIFTISMRIRWHGKHKDIVHFVPLSTLLSEVVHSQGIPRRSVVWDTWGPGGTCMVNGRPSDVWVCYIYGMRYAQPQPYRNSRNLAEVCDFNPYAMRKTSTDLWKPFPSRKTATTLSGRIAAVSLNFDVEGWEATMLGESHILIVRPKSSTCHFMAM